MWAALGQIAAQLGRSAAAAAAAASGAGRAAAGGAGKAAAQAAQAGARVPPVVNPATASSAAQTAAGAANAAAGKATGIPLPASASAAGRAPPPPPLPPKPGPTPSQQAAAGIAGQVKQQVIGSAVTMGSSLLTNTIGSVVGGLVTNRGQKGQGGGPVSGYLDRLGAGPAGNRVGQSLDGVAKTAAKVVDPTGLGRGTMKGIGMVANVGTLGLAGHAKKLGEKFVELATATEDWGRELMDSQKHLMAFNGNIARAFLETERRDILRNIESGKNTGATTSNLANAWNDLKDEMQPFKDVLTNSLNTIAIAVTMVVKTVVKYGKPLAEGVLFMQKNWPWGDKSVEADELPPFQEFLKVLSDNFDPDARVQ